MQILVTGASGFLGTAWCQALEQNGHAVVPVSSRVADLTQAGSLERFNSVRFDQIHHLAAWTQAGDFCLKHPGEQWLINQQINTNMPSWWHAQQPQTPMI